MKSIIDMHLTIWLQKWTILIKIYCQLGIIVLIDRKTVNNVWYDTNMVGKYVDKLFSFRRYHGNGMVDSIINGNMYINAHGTHMTTCITRLKYEMYISVYNTHLYIYVWWH